MNQFYDNLVDTQSLLESAILMIDTIVVHDILTKEYPGVSVYDRIESLIIPVLERIGLGWEKGEYALSQVYMSGRICEDMVDLLLPPNDPDRIDQPKMAIVTLEDYHVLGKRIVYSALRAGGFGLEDYGRMTVEPLVERVAEEDIKILLVSTLMLPAALNVKVLVDGIKAHGKNTRVIVGGAPFNYDPVLWKDVGADGYGKTATQAVKLVHQMIDEVTA